MAKSKTTESKQIQPNKDWSKPIEVDTLTLAFPANVIGTYLPTMSEIPEEFKNRRNPWDACITKLFFSGGRIPKTKEGIDQVTADRHVRTVLGSYEPKHQHKQAGAAWLMSLWYSEPVVGDV